jgi:hypothetical protein
MTLLTDRQKALEGKFARDENLKFKATARRNKLVGLWAADLFALKGDAADEYAKTVVIADLEEAGDADVIRKLVADFKSHNVEMSEHRIEKALLEQMAVAIKQIEAK